MPAPLSGITVLDLTHVLAGPFCSSTLQDLGARIIKVERPVTGDDTRAFPPFLGGESAYFAALNAGKHSIALDLKQPADRAIFDRLLGRADILLENYRPGVMERLGYGYDSLHARFPRLIYGAVSGFGHTGPDAAKPAYDMVVQARGGVMSITGEEGGPPVRVGASIGDIVAGMYLAQGVLAALYSREKTGEGAKIDIAMLDAQIPIQEHAIAIATATGHPPGPTGARHPTITPFSTFRAADGFFVIAAGNDALFGKLCTTLGLDPADPRFATNGLRCDNVHLLKRLIETVTLQQPVAHWIATLDAAGIPTGRVQNMAQALADPQILARNMVLPVTPRDGGGPAFTAAGNPIKMSTLPEQSARPPAPTLDGDRAAILDWLDHPA
ncbi:CaiB/BaiF CoA transferase family protein [Paragemmobacter straminiformis]|uniref:CoA transferase n=1 Tax=Paragemmobacter straminiformis TaxID=2045119 RepID=A0A842I783_9RHOB|nr:CoA transferase [Gemmobacter straminiformis]MBC2835431.1 CoA transferase [Gemmobacter straminiformis]